MFRIILQPGELALLERVRQGQPGARGMTRLIRRLTAFGMLVADEDGALHVTELGEAALARMNRAMH